MDDSILLKAKEILKKYKQEHLLCLYDELSDEEKCLLVNQILKINFDEILNLYENSKKDNFFVNQKISPLYHFEKKRFSKDEIDYYTRFGEEELLKESFAVVTMAGGQGTRLGYKGPKGTYMLDLKPVKKSLFEIMCEDIKFCNKT